MIDIGTDEKSRAAVRVLTILEGQGIKLPKATAEAIATHRGAEQRLADLTARSHTLRDVVADYLATGTKPTDLDELLLALTVSTRPEGQYALTATRHAIVSAVKDDSPVIIKALRPMFDKAASALDGCAETLGNVALDDLPAVTALGGNAAEQWKRAKAAEDVVNTVLTVVQHLITIGGYPGNLDPRERRLAVLDCTLEGYTHIGKETGAWEMRRHGTLSLADADEFTRRKDAIYAAWSRSNRNPSAGIPAGVGQYGHAV